MSAAVDSKGGSKVLSRVDASLPLVTPRAGAAPAMLVPIEMVRACRTEGQAFTLACNASGLDDKEIYIPLRIDAGTFSKIKAGKASFPRDQLKPFCELVNNYVFPEYLAWQVGCTLTLIETEAERLLRSEREQRAAVEAENRRLHSLLAREAT